ncbi:putative collagen alpha-1 [Operophtera brumata]|uniref:Putative collagen alpha-1 n=1 Tax=Operophtera brumata TaxID=104452 RepID=A0A0L7LB04_OPEBR|nr:putative collagen alpha-1 [Operophtera brumata]
MAKPKESDKKKVLNTVVLWSCSGFFFILCGYGLYRQHCLEQRVLVLEEQFKEFTRTVQSQQPQHQELALRRETRDAGDCICPAG